MEEGKQKYLNTYFAKEIIKTFAIGIQGEDKELFDGNLSCAEAVGILRHTIDVIEKKIPLDFSGK